jgi:hypothetical protein
MNQLDITLLVHKYEHRIATLVAALRGAKREHERNCQARRQALDTTECFCGAEAHNAAIEAAIKENT